MKILSQKKLVRISIVIMLSLALEITLRIALGYFPPGGLLFLALIFVVSAVYYGAILIYAIAIVRSTINTLNKLFFMATWLLLVLVGLIPSGHFVTLGALYSIYNNQPASVVGDSIELMREYKPMTCFGFPERFPCDNPITPKKLPLSIQKVYPEHVLILNDAVLIEKFGLGGIYRGFVVFAEGKDVWKDSPAIQLLRGCNDCWRIRIQEGLYWYHETEEYPIDSMFTDY